MAAVVEASDLEEEFNETSEFVKKWDNGAQATTAEKLDAYKYFKQATIGDVNTTRPGMMDFTGKSKWDAWETAKGVSKDEAMTKYIETIKAQRAKYGDGDAGAAAPAAAEGEAEAEPAVDPALEAEFNETSEFVKKWDKGAQATNAEKLEAYKYFKQATVGDCHMPRPGMVDFTGKSKWDAWDSAKGVKMPEAMTKYIETIKAQRAKYGE